MRYCSKIQKSTSADKATQRGSVLIAVLAIVLLLSYMITRFMNEAVDELEYKAIFNEPTDVRVFGYSLLEAALATLQEVALIDDGKLYAPEQGWADPIAYTNIPIPDGWEVYVDIQDESGKLPFNTMDEALLNRLLEDTLELDFGTARELSSTLADWIDADDSARLNGAESDEYLDRSPPYKAANAPLQSLQELRYIKIWEDEFFTATGQPNELYLKLEEMVSVLNTGTANLNSSPQSVLDLITLQDGFPEGAVFDNLREEPYLKNLPESLNSQVSGVGIQLLRITVRMQRGNSPFIISALVEPTFADESNSAGAASGDAPGSSADESAKTGAISEQQSINYPFKILQLSEYTQAMPQTTAARYSAIDISE